MAGYSEFLTGLTCPASVVTSYAHAGEIPTLLTTAQHFAFIIDYRNEHPYPPLEVSEVTKDTLILTHVLPSTFLPS